MDDDDLPSPIPAGAFAVSHQVAEVRVDLTWHTTDAASELAVRVAGALQAAGIPDPDRLEAGYVYPERRWDDGPVLGDDEG